MPVQISRGSRGADVLKLQSLINRVGGMLEADGAFGAGTKRGVMYAQKLAQLPETGIADDALMQWLENQPEPFPKLSADGVSLIAREETGGLHYYSLHTAFPHYPGVQSGVTIGIGYDLRFSTVDQFRDTWMPVLPESVINELEKDIGKKGSKTRVNELKRMGIEVPFYAAWKAFLDATLPNYYQQTLNAFPSLEELPPMCRSILVGLIYNRGASMSNKDRRREMVNIRDLLAKASQQAGQARIETLLDIEDEFISMKRLWPAGSGLVIRRQREANHWRESILENH